ncbi:hypothetical protein GT755_01845 [Herbidospora sp. NEAU-GS84]|uniref:Uncharacterized protein n=1 Tax=Herbidospora solisilvae TaxID=2696284 RepID=A0A7C9J0A0_9ACTN|nr:hypothetical protein [Herbidospora solisilvae]NAS20425.1 hypothetical protein [Herbidospora solisilvae]
MKLTLPCGRQVWGHKGHVPGYATYSFHEDRRSLTVAVTALRSGTLTPFMGPSPRVNP